MSWMQKLCEAYDSGIVSDQSREATKLVPLGFVRKKIKYHVVLTQDGRFVSADELMDEAQDQEIPSTPQAESRTGDSGAPFPLSEQLKYLIYEEQNRKRFERYMEQLNLWCEQSDAPPCLRAVYMYLEGHTLLEDLESQPGLKLKYYKNADKREGTGEDAKAMVCFSVQMQDGNADDLWLRSDIRQSWSNYLADRLPGNREFCYVEGKPLPIVENHPKLQGNAKLISAKDAEFPFQYRGRFAEERSAALVSYDASVRAHNALIWLIARQGFRKYGMTWVVWNTNGAMMKVPIDEENDFYGEEDEDDEDSKPIIDTFEGYARAVKKAAEGYGGNLQKFNPERTNCAVILGLEAATDGRMSVTYYQELVGNEYTARLEAWYRDCCWRRYIWNKKEWGIAAPTPNDIAIAVMGIDMVNLAKQDMKCEKSYTKFMRNLQSRILICIADRQAIPYDFVHSAFARVCAPLSFVGGKDRQWSRIAWESSVETTCAMISCFQTRRNKETCEGFGPELQACSRNSDYLYGRLLAAADFIEEKAMGNGRNFPTNAIGLMQKFVQRPFETWPKIHEKLLPSFRKLGVYSKWYQMLLEEIETLFSEQNRYERGQLSLEFLQGFSSQRQKLFKAWEKHEKEQETEVFELPKRRSELYGCFLAIADAAEENASDGERAGMTNAMQMMPVIAAKPYGGWRRLHDKLIPYLEKLGAKSGYYQWLIGIVEMQFPQEERESEAPLDGSYLHGYYCMRRALYQDTHFSWDQKVWTDVKDMRSALYGNLLGIAERMEKRYFMGRTEKETTRFTSEVRFMAAFAQKPAVTWENIKMKLEAYMRYPGGGSEDEIAVMEQIEMQLQEQGWNTNIPLSGVYLHEYYVNRI